jgi:hypothetical protein
MPIATLPSICWTTTSRFEDGHDHWDTEAQALRIVIQQFTEDTTAPGELPGRYTACCLTVECDGRECGETLVDHEWEFPIHFDTYREATEYLAEDARAEDRSKRSDFPYRGWIMTPGGGAWCPACREEGQVPPPPLTRAEQADAGQQVLL